MSLGGAGGGAEGPFASLAAVCHSSEVRHRSVSWRRHSRIIAELPQSGWCHLARSRSLLALGALPSSSSRDAAVSQHLQEGGLPPCSSDQQRLGCEQFLSLEKAAWHCAAWHCWVGTLPLST